MFKRIFIVNFCHSICLIFSPFRQSSVSAHTLTLVGTQLKPHKGNVVNTKNPNFMDLGGDMNLAGYIFFDVNPFFSYTCM